MNQLLIAFLGLALAAATAHAEPPRDSTWIGQTDSVGSLPRGGSISGERTLGGAWTDWVSNGKGQYPSAWARCPAGTQVVGHEFRTSNNSQENMQVQVTTSSGACWRPKDGNSCRIRLLCN